MPRPTDWIDTLLDFNVATGTGAFRSLMTGVAPVNMRGMTLIRTIIKLNMYSNTTAGAWGVQRADIGIGVADQDAFAATALPDPNVSTDKPARGWVYRTQELISQNGVGTRIVFDVQADIRAARKVENGELYIGVFNTAETGTTFAINVFGLIRTLYKL